MNILIISDSRLPSFIEKFLGKNNINFYKVRGSIKSKAILDESEIRYIFLFYNTAIKRIKKDILTTINQYPIPVILFFDLLEKHQLDLTDEELKYFHYKIPLLEDEVEVITNLSFAIDGSTKINKLNSSKKTSNYKFRNFFNRFKKRKQKKINKTSSNLALHFSLEVSNDEKNELLDGLSSSNKKKFMSYFSKKS